MTDQPARDRAALRERIAAALAREDAHNAGYDHGFVRSYGADEETDGFVDAVLAVLPEPTDQAAEAQPADRTRALALLEAAEFVRDAHFRDGLTVQEIGTALGHMADEADPMVGSLSRDGFDHDEITTILATSVAEALLADTDEARPAAAARPDDTTGA